MTSRIRTVGRALTAIAATLGVAVAAFIVPAAATAEPVVATTAVTTAVSGSQPAVSTPAASTPAASMRPFVAANAADFDPGFIVSDENFYQGGAMSPAQVQSFLLSQNGSCDYSRAQAPCLFEYTQATPSLGATARCGAYPGAANERAADIIAKVGAVCGISQKVLLVLLQKEQSLVTDNWPYWSQYNHATGYGCPDTAPCDPNYNGFFYQVYWAAYAFQAYRANNGGNYHPGWNTILYNPDRSCGSSQVYIQNLATAGLYTYTPYQPNASALANLYGSGDRCGAYGNRNFWRLWTDWFGSPTNPPSNSTGHFDASSIVLGEDSGELRANGWAYDTMLPTLPATMHIYVTDPAGVLRIQVLTADHPRPDVGAAFPAAGPNHGWSMTMPAPLPGTYTICAYALASSGAAATLGCQWQTITSEAPRGWYDGPTVVAVEGESLSATLSGWMYQPNLLEASGRVHVYLTKPDRTTSITVVPATLPRPDLAGPLGLTDTNRGYSHTFPVTAPGQYTVCVYAMGLGWMNAGNNPQLGCRTLNFASGVTGDMNASIEQTETEAKLRVDGWALNRTWPTLTTRAHVYVGTNGAAPKMAASVAASEENPAAETAVPGAGTAHGYAYEQPITSPGTYAVCAYGIGMAPFDAGRNPALGCETLSVVRRAPIGHLDAVTKADGGLRLSGWSLDQDAGPLSTDIHVYATDPSGVTKLVRVAKADRPRGDIDAAFGLGANHGFETTISATQVGTYTVCAYGIGTAVLNKGANSLLGCSSISTAPQAPIGSLDAATRTESGIFVSGWSIQRDMPTTPTAVHVYVTAPDGTRTLAAAPTASNLRHDVAAVYPGVGPNHGYTVTIPATQVGTYEVCAYGIGTGAWNAGANSLLGCRTVSTAPNSPIGNLDGVRVTDAGIRVQGWSLQRDVSGVPTQVRIDVTAPDGSTSTTEVTASASRPDVGRAYGVDPTRGFDATIPISAAGDYRVCVTALGAGVWNAGTTTPLGCRVVTS